MSDTQPNSGTCFACLCTDERACEGGCYWIDPDHTLCSVCSHRVVWLSNLSLAEAVDALKETEHGQAVRLLTLRSMHMQRVGFLQLRECSIESLAELRALDLEKAQRAFAVLGDPRARRPYSKPRLTRFGTLPEITQAVGFISRTHDGGGPKTGNKTA
jgi:hypothetical protein